MTIALAYTYSAFLFHYYDSNICLKNLWFLKALKPRKWWLRSAFQKAELNNLPSLDRTHQSAIKCEKLSLCHLISTKIRWDLHMLTEQTIKSKRKQKGWHIWLSKYHQKPFSPSNSLNRSIGTLHAIKALSTVINVIIEISVKTTLSLTTIFGH